MRGTRRTWWMLPLLLVVVVGIDAAGREASLVETVKAGDAEAVRALLLRVDVNTPTVDGTTALHWAVHRDDRDMVNLLIRAGADVTAANRYGVTPLTLACTNGDAATIMRLLEAGADPNSTRPGGETALMTAALTGEPEAIQVLLAYGADVDARESARGQTALMWAAAEGNAAAVAMLVEAGADIHSRSRGPVSAEVEKVEKSGTGAGVGRNYSRRGRIDAFTPLLFAVRAGRLDAARVLIEHGAEVNDTAPDGTSALIIAAVNAHWDVAALLLDKGADPNVAGQGWTALHQVARTRTYNIGQFPHPVPTGHLSSLDVAKKLVARGADVNARMTKAFDDGYRFQVSYRGATPLFVAAKGADAELMRLLVANGADPTLTNASQATALMVASGVDMFYVEEDSGTNEDAVEATRVALDLGIDVNAVNDKGETALHGAAARGSNPIVQLLVDHGARLDVHNKRGFTPLHIANGDDPHNLSIERRPETVALLRQLMIVRGLPADELPPVTDIRLPGDRKLITR